MTEIYDLDMNSKIICNTIEELIIKNKNKSILWLSGNTQNNYKEIIDKILNNFGENIKLIHYGISNNPLFVVFEIYNYEFVLYLDREYDYDYHIVHLKKYEIGTDYKNYWNRKLISFICKTSNNEIIDYTELCQNDAY